ncbi:MAG: acylphosphatase [Elusimicrobia bacterium]|nr:acylphosphatase [Elusimicrobiota bacterium]
MPDPLTRRRFVVSGRVQGVGFRWFAQRWAERLGLRGWVSNLEDGSVASEAEGPAQAVAEFERRLRAGPAGAQVNAVEATERKPEGGPSSFDIL